MHRIEAGKAATIPPTGRARLANERDSSAPGASALTSAELRLLPLLSTHLSLPEIAGELSLFPHTIKSQAYSIYRKLGASSRSQAPGAGRSVPAPTSARPTHPIRPKVGGGFEAQTGAFYAEAARVFESPIPVVAAVQGAAIGAGLGLALACDVRVVGADGWFQANFVRLGIHPGFALSLVLPDVIGPACSPSCS